MAEDTLIRVVEEREALRAEVARLREAFDISSAAHAQAEAVLAAERAAHEATERSRQEATDRALGIAAKLDETVRALEATKAELAKEQRLTRFSSTETRNALAEEMNAHAKTQAELERRTAWSNAQLAELEQQVADLSREWQKEQRLSACQQARALDAEAALDQARGLLDAGNAAEAAEARVAELKRELVAQELRHVRTREERTALDQARRLLGRVTGAVSDRLLGDIEEWLRAHPATPEQTIVHITREGEPLCGASFAPGDVGFYARERVEINCRPCLAEAHRRWPEKWPATPAATGVELQIVECTDTPRGRAREKEAKG